jgi:hypothetical protein
MALPRLSLKSASFQADFFTSPWTAAEKEDYRNVCIRIKKTAKLIFFTSNLIFFLFWTTSAKFSFKIKITAVLRDQHLLLAIYPTTLLSHLSQPLRAFFKVKMGCKENFYFTFLRKFISNLTKRTKI